MPPSIHDEVYWRGVKPRWKKPAKKKLTPAQEKARKEKINRQKRESDARKRAAHPGGLAGKIAAESEACYDLDRIKAQIEIEPVTGCWLWLGHYHVCWDRPRPLIRNGQDGRAWADIAAWVVAKGRKLPRGYWLQRDCENIKCVNPDHGLIANAQLERARRRLYELGKQEDGRRRDEGERAAHDGDERGRDAGERPERSEGE